MVKNDLMGFQTTKTVENKDEKKELMPIIFDSGVTDVTVPTLPNENRSPV